MSKTLQHINSVRQEGKKQLAILLDPDDYDSLKEFSQTIELIHQNEKLPDFIFIGGSLLMKDRFDLFVKTLKKKTSIPVVIFPGSPLQVSEYADAILLLSLISGRNAETLIGYHVLAAPQLKRAQIEIISTGYLLIDCGEATTASYMSNTTPIPYRKDDIAACTALAGEQLGMKMIYIDGGSGAAKPVSISMLLKIRETIDLPIIVGGGITNSKMAQLAWGNGADVVVVGTAFEKDDSILKELLIQRDLIK